MGSLLPSTSPSRCRTPTLLLGTTAEAWSTLAVPRFPEVAVAPTSTLVRATQYFPPGTDAARSWIPSCGAPEAGRSADQALATPRGEKKKNGGRGSLGDSNSPAARPRDRSTSIGPVDVERDSSERTPSPLLVNGAPGAPCSYLLGEPERSA
ncbi:hypothetical protein NDU88_004368 [Pleurodeles waltl]|uniref:Uncharacterized protein n=1 Tax=Pleurodeles waltl TaxID=8319 RepID=A0AAV7N2T7_PLEWA|nr:hypothetical protein NDU88_004368 [Pleurodeles waltl]